LAYSYDKKGKWSKIYAKYTTNKIAINTTPPIDAATSAAKTATATILGYYYS